MRNFFFFEKMLTPSIITFVYWLLLVSTVILGLSTMFSGYQGFTTGTFFMGLLYIAGGIVGARIWCELLIVIFKINEALQDLRQKKT
ncbi:DUF4282 domain-containing protein [Ectothiorhodospira mobilis]|uniref:DUF4282 domain-containing protein n=1 Tax=Ectothiorhodospira mobilis TaxID=195064 RepID=UPI001EE810FF|nr:DUF4282 domain-containing protein [Ectothiorhodospira mobilis]MCG5535958.1 DUF4282 domain-containing protein [Ectothiorhodospira mobilis]